MSAETLGTVREDMGENTNRRKRNGGGRDAGVGQVLRAGLSYRAFGGLLAGEPGGRAGGRPCPLRLI
jgi:hypothetical protein